MRQGLSQIAASFILSYIDIMAFIPYNEIITKFETVWSNTLSIFMHMRANEQLSGA